MSELHGQSMLQGLDRRSARAMRPYLTAALLGLALLLAAGSTYAAPGAGLAGSLASAGGPITGLSASDAHSCATLTDGTIRCWGYNPVGELGDGTQIDRWTPVTVSGITTASDVAAGYQHTCAALSSGGARCWGFGLSGQLGNGAALNSYTPVTVSGITNAAQVAAGRFHSCAVLADGTVKCWGDNGSGQLGNGTTTSSSSPVAVSGISTATDIALGSSFSCARLTDQTIKCWGGGAIGNGTTSSLTPATVTGITTAIQLAAGGGHACAALSTGALRCWGDNFYRQLGDGTTTYRTTPVPVSGISTGTWVGPGETHTCARLSDGTAKCWGNNQWGQLGDGTRTNRSSPVAVVGLTTAAEVTAGLQHSCARLSDNTAMCWGEDLEGELGDGTMTKQWTPSAVLGVTTATEVATGAGHACARLVDSTVRCWGRNTAGQLGNGTTTDSSTSVAVSGITTATQVAAGNGFSCARFTDSSVKCWGGNSFGNLGNGTTTPSTTPVTVSGITTATQVTAGWGHACAVLSDSTVRCWGNNSQGQLGDGTTQNRLTPVAVQGITTAVEVGAGNIHTCARLENETAKCWGDNFWGQLGDGTQTDQLTPVAVPGIATATQVEAGDLHSCARLANATVTCWGELQLTPTVVPGITTASQASAGAAHSCARLADSTARCWGPNDYGQLGNGTFTASSTPVVVSGINTATQVSAGLVAGYGPHTCARLSDSTVRCWGNAYYGQLGNGVFGYSLVPVAVAIGRGSPPPPPDVTTTSLPGGTVSQAYSQSVTATGGTTPYSWTVSAGSLPPGLSLTVSGTPTATISGTPSTAGTYNVTVRVTDGVSATDTQDLSIVVAPPAPPPVNPQLLDNFNRPNEIPVYQSGNWASIGISGGSGARLQSNRLQSFSQPGLSYRLAPYNGGGMEASVTVTTVPSNNHWVSVFVCLQDPGTSLWDGYELRATRLSSTDMWQIRRIDNGVSASLGTTNLEMATGGTMLLRKFGDSLEFWWKPSSGTWQLKLTALDPGYQWGMIGAGGFQSGALDNFGGGSLLPLLAQYAPQLEYDDDENFHADAASSITNYFVPGARSNELKNSSGSVLASSDETLPGPTLSLDSLVSSQATYPWGGTPSSGDFLNEGGESLEIAVDAQLIHASPQYRNQIYGRAWPVPGGGYVLQYWLFSYFNTHYYFGDHEGDWEMVQYRLDSRLVPVMAAYSQHDGGERCEWIHVQINSLGRPIVYVANGSHASFYSSGLHFYQGGAVADNADADGEVAQPAVHDLGLPGLAWLDWPGKWGSSDGSFGSPTGPKVQGAGFKWSNPQGWETSIGGCTEDQEQVVMTRPERPASPKVEAQESGANVVVSYVFDGQSWPLPSRLRVSVDPIGRITPISSTFDVADRRGRVVLPAGLARGRATIVRVTGLSDAGIEGKEVSVRLN